MLGTVQVGPAFRRSVLEKDGKEVVGGVVLMRYGENPLEVTRRVKEKITRLQAEWMRVRQEVYTYTDEFKAAAAKWEEQVKTRAGWAVVKPTAMTAASGSTMKVIDDGSVLVQARRPARETYTVTLPAGSKPITAIRLEALPDTTHPRGGVGRSENDGNFVLSRFAVKAKAKDGKATDLAVASAQADFSQDQYPVEHAIKNVNQA